MKTHFDNLLFVSSFLICCIFPSPPHLHCCNLILGAAYILPSEQGPNTPRCQECCLLTVYSWVLSRNHRELMSCPIQGRAPSQQHPYPRSGWHRGQRTLPQTDITEEPINWNASPGISWVLCWSYRTIQLPHSPLPASHICSEMFPEILPNKPLVDKYLFPKEHDLWYFEEKKQCFL